jgi:hypothetical protein
MGKAGNLALLALAPLVLATLALAWACSCPQPAPAIAPLHPDSPAQTRQQGEPRTPLVAPNHPDWVRVEAAEKPNTCSADDQCFVGGCEAEICSARPGLRSTCQGKNWPSKGGLCGCVAGKCTWYRAKQAPPAEPAPAPNPEPETDAGPAPVTEPDLPTDSP